MFINGGTAVECWVLDEKRFSVCLSVTQGKTTQMYITPAHRAERSASLGQTGHQYTPRSTPRYPRQCYPYAMSTLQQASNAVRYTLIRSSASSREQTLSSWERKTERDFVRARASSPNALGRRKSDAPPGFTLRLGRGYGTKGCLAMRNCSCLASCCA